MCAYVYLYACVLVLTCLCFLLLCTCVCVYVVGAHEYLLLFFHTHASIHVLVYKVLHLARKILNNNITLIGSKEHLYHRTVKACGY